jgi:hypothetical protein
MRAWAGVDEAVGAAARALCRAGRDSFAITLKLGPDESAICGGFGGQDDPATSNINPPDEVPFPPAGVSYLCKMEMLPEFLKAAGRQCLATALGEDVPDVSG